MAGILRDEVILLLHLTDRVKRQTAQMCRPAAPGDAARPVWRHRATAASVPADGRRTNARANAAPLARYARPC